MHELFRRLAHRTSVVSGSPLAFLGALGVIVGWLASGPIFHFSDTWQLVINTGTTIVTFLMVFLIQNTQNRDSHALHLKLDELIYANKRARNKLLALEDLSDEEMKALQTEFEHARDARASQRISRAVPNEESDADAPSSAGSHRPSPRREPGDE